ncbi:MAG: purine-binding chemotaxis protein CheW [Nitrospira sp.]|nr:purine-binding chemotaxis protein CheW [Nitrospira sp.]
MPVSARETSVGECNQPAGLTTDGNQYLTFNLGEEFYGVDILRVREIKGYSTVTKIPHTPPHIKGVLNLRGTIVPIVELRTKFGMPTVEYTAFTVIILVVVRDKVIGLVVDSVSDVLNIDKKDIQPPPQFGSKVNVSFMSGIGKSGEKLVTLLNMEHLLVDGDMAENSVAMGEA